MTSELKAFVLRPLAAADAVPVAALIRDAFSDLPVDPDPPMSALCVTAAEIAAHLETGSGAVAEAGSQLIGSALWSERGGGLYVSRIAVTPSWRRHGLARALIAAAESAARRKGLPRVHLSTRLVLTGNRRLFAACGFVETAVHAHPGYAEPTFVDMEKWLSAERR